MRRCAPPSWSIGHLLMQFERPPGSPPNLRQPSIIHGHDGVNWIAPQDDHLRRVKPFGQCRCPPRRQPYRERSLMARYEGTENKCHAPHCR
eukprot:scaffold148969_cov27-Tisochrysis_lutea.AAC.4